MISVTSRSSILESIRTCKDKIRHQKPVIHHITNFVTIYQCARVTSFLGAAPVMAFAAEEAAQITARSDALVINTGTLNPEVIRSIPASVSYANAHGIPVVLDPVGVRLSDYRYQFISDLLTNYHFDVIRCNHTELQNLCGSTAAGKGIDGLDPFSGDTQEAFVTVNVPDAAVTPAVPDIPHIPDAPATRIAADAPAAQDALSLAARCRCVVACTGPTDYISDGQTVTRLAYGSPLLPRLVGTGCMVNSLIASCLPVCDCAADAAILGILIMCMAGEGAQAGLKNPSDLGSFETLLMDEISS